MRCPGWRLRTLSPVAGALLLTGCGQAPPDPATPRVEIQCGTNAEISKEQQAKAADEIDALPQGSIIAEIIVPDWGRMRDENRACRKPAGK
jgi:hypothetical protein